MKIEEDLTMKRKIQGYKDRRDESLGERRGPERKFHQSLKDRRDETRGMEKHEKNHSYGNPHEMDEHDQKRMHHHMMEAHHKFMAHHHRRNMNKK